MPSTDYYPMPPDHRYPMPGGGGIDHYPMDRYPMMPPPGSADRYYPSKPAPGPNDDKNYLPPPGSNHYPGDDDRYSNRDRDYGNKDRYNPDAMYPDQRHPPNRGRPEPAGPAYSVRYPEEMMMKYPPPNSIMGSYGSSENRFPVGTDRFPTNIYKYGNERDRVMPGYGPMPPGYGGYPITDMTDRGYMPSRGPSRPMIAGGGGAGPASPPFIMVGWGGGMPTHVPDSSMYGSHYGPASRPIGPIGIRCDDADSYRQMGLRQKMKKQFVRRSTRASTLTQCQRECTSAADFVCRSFNYREEGERAGQGETFNCELSDRDLRELDLNNPQMFETSNYDFYERSIGGRSNDGECLDVSQTCNEDGMEFTLRTNEPFTGRVYSYGFYDR